MALLLVEQPRIVSRSKQNHPSLAAEASIHEEPGAGNRAGISTGLRG